VRYAGSGEELVLQGEEVTEDEGRALVDGKSRSEQLEPRVLEVVRTKGPLSGRAVHRELKKAGEVGRRTVEGALERLESSGRIAEGKDGYVLPGSLVPTPEAP
jgi:Penicillinase repressor